MWYQSLQSLSKMLNWISPVEDLYNPVNFDHILNYRDLETIQLWSLPNKRFQA